MMPDATIVNIVIRLIGLYANTHPHKITHRLIKHIMLNVVNFLFAI